MNHLIPALAAAAAGALAPTPAHSPEARAACREAILQVREATGQPRLQREAASADKPLLIAAVDKRIDNCRVLVMARDTRDIRPEPEPGSNRARLLPAR